MTVNNFHSRERPAVEKIIRSEYLAPVPILIFLLTVLLLAPGFYRNTWSTVGEQWFIEWTTVKDASFVGRLVQSRQAGVFSYAGFLGHGDASEFSDSTSLVAHQYEVYKNNEAFANFTSYNSALDLQGILSSGFDTFTDFTPEFNLVLFRTITCLLTAISLGLFIVWLHAEFGILAAFFALGFMVLSEWLTLFGGSIFWSLWAFYLPFLAMAYYFRKHQTSAEFGKLPGILVFSTILIKCLFNGFEFITTALLMIFVPVLYYASINKWDRRMALRLFGSMALAEGLAVLAALGILMIQNAYVLGGLDQAIEYISFTLGKRSIGDPESYTGAIAQSLQADLFPVLKQYITGRAINLDLEPLYPLGLGFLPRRLEINYALIMSAFLAATLIFLFIRRHPGTSPYITKVSSLVLVTWISVLGPLSWFVIFKAHSYLHTHLNFIVWQLPFAILGFAMCGAILRSFRPGNQK